MKSLGFRMAYDIVSIVLFLNSALYRVSTIVDWRKERKGQARVLEEAGEEKLLLSFRGDLP